MNHYENRNDILDFLIKVQDEKFDSIYEALAKIDDKLNHFHKRIHDITNNTVAIDKMLEITANNVIHFSERLNKIEEDYIRLKEKIVSIEALEKVRTEKTSFVVDLLSKWRVWLVIITIALAIDFTNLIKIFSQLFSTNFIGK